MGRLCQFMMNDYKMPSQDGCIRKKVLTIAGSDCSGGAGIQADLKTMTAHGIYGMSVITAITVQNTLGVTRAEQVCAELVKGQFDAVCSDILPDAVKTGMLFSADIIDIAACKIKEYNLKNIVVDPVLVSTSGNRLLELSAESVLIEKLLPLAILITPNIPEAEALSGISIHSKEDMVLAASKLCQSSGANVLVKGGHSTSDADDLLYCTEATAGSLIPDGSRIKWFYGERIKTHNTHGTGCTLSSAIACNLAYGMDIITAVSSAKDYLSGALKPGLCLGSGNGPVDHCFSINKEPANKKPHLLFV